VSYVWKQLLTFALLLALVIAGLYAGYKVTEPRGDHTDAVSSAASP
jgi:hypothetical protein